MLMNYQKDANNHILRFRSNGLNNKKYSVDVKGSDRKGYKFRRILEIVMK